MTLATRIYTWTAGLVLATTVASTARADDLPRMDAAPGQCADCGRPKRTFKDRWRQRWADFKYDMQWCMLGFPDQFDEPAQGTFLNAHIQMQITNGNAARM